MNEISRKEVATMLSKIKYCHNYNSCNYSCKFFKRNFNKTIDKKSFMD